MRVTEAVARTSVREPVPGRGRTAARLAFAFVRGQLETIRALARVIAARPREMDRREEEPWF